MMNDALRGLHVTRHHFTLPDTLPWRGCSPLHPLQSIPCLHSEG